MRVVVLGNCQAEGIAAATAAAGPSLQVRHASIAGVAPDAPVVAEWSAWTEAADVVFSLLTDAQLSDYGLPTEAACLERGKRFVRLPVLAFRGFHPDCTYVITGGTPITGLMGPYHSALAAAAWLEGLDVGRTLRLFNVFAYSALGYFDEFSQAGAVIDASARAIGLDLSGPLGRSDRVFMHTINHPTIAMLEAVADAAMVKAGIVPDPSPPTPPDALAQSYIWPVYPPLASRLGCSGSLDFRRAETDGGATLRLQEVVEDTHGALARHAAIHGPIELDQDRPFATPVIERARAFIRRHVVT